MEILNIEGTPKTPTITLNPNTGVLEIKGRSIPENSIEFYRPVVEWIEMYAASPAANTEFNVRLEYFNTASSKCILDVFKKLEAVKHGNSAAHVQVNWFYEEDDEDMLEAGEDYESIIKVPFNMMPMKS
ncbi:MAG: DUF1987 domain-containing protein [Bacteroidales bacterium]|nr:DUF1987 domain-containing protein [Bacteroidales bacterium]